jgi:hypothetical protein
MMKLIRKILNRPVYFTSCSEMPLENFVSYINKADASLLVRRGEADPHQAAIHWDAIYGEYCELVGLVAYKQLISNYKEVARMQAVLIAVESAIYVLTLRRSDKCAAVLDELGYSFKEGDDRLQQLDVIATRVKTLRVQRELKEKDYPKLTKDKTKTTRGRYIRKGIMHLVKFMGVPIDTRKTTVYEYAMMQRLLIDENKRVEKNGRTDKSNR